MSSTSTEMLSTEDILRKKSKINLTKLILFLVLSAVVGLVVGLLIGAFAICDKDNSDGLFLKDVPDTLVSEENPDISDLILNSIDPERIESYLRDLTKHPHIAGRSRDFELVTLLQNHFKSNGLHVQTTPYDVLLSYPSDVTPNSVRLINASGSVVYDAKEHESDISGEPDVVMPFNAYSPNRLVEGELVFVNYGRVEDYDDLLRIQNISVDGRIVIVKYGKLFRGDKVDIAASYGAIGIIIYSDPYDYTGFKEGDYRVYPDTWWLPSTGVQRGTVFTGDGDPLTPGYPANNLAYRYDEDKVDPPLPKIPSHPIGYGAAAEILKHLNGAPIPNWKGSLNVSYNTGPGFLQNGMTIQLNVTTTNKRAKAENVFGLIRGTVEPDRYVLVGNHRDAWIYGAIDPSSGTAVIMELATVMGALVKSGQWKPRRSIMFCSWGAEEFGLIGSTEWVEQYVATLRERAVAYINVDIAVLGNDTLKVASTPLMHNIIYDASKKVPNPNPKEVESGRKTVYDTWLHVTNNSGLPLITTPASGSDFAPILQRAGITALDMSYAYDSNKYKIAYYALYHTEYEKFAIVKSQFDQQFLFHAAIAQLSGEMSRRLADSLILPFNVSNYAAGLETLRKELDKDYGASLKSNLSNYDMLEIVIQNFTKDVHDFETRLKSVNKNNPFALRTVNDQIMLLERAFLEPEGLPGRPKKKHLIFAESDHDSYAGSSFPGLVDLMFKIGTEPERWEKVKQHFSVVLQTIQSAGAMLRDVTNFMSETL
ncbi:putative N-acetylated-alpha-linked acidic dipeptidase [Biomphalaria glabrata]|uniref:N-acetylated-alpha-linked acidic dipeptidase n=1 Tax=Biomphalaria glabrata TaxID=6526 RepID=A0A9W3A0K8_BIOGL|nr:putative N-acetylated-alpha-linked acidic dipeptidase [Biomphalaria glabrata]XP_055880857.1 putative N-acetylated-alpha-linked acidic dipeptidase [Biomphalaria glabrata]XP_055880858.1 putative N-acetylated-alpha-linked acidic dipeptidase [Biomphalaria glabrata]